jgi:hypothetical protein
MCQHRHSIVFIRYFSILLSLAIFLQYLMKLRRIFQNLSKEITVSIVLIKVYYRASCDVPISKCSSQEPLLICLQPFFIIWSQSFQVCLEISIFNTSKSRHDSIFKFFPKHLTSNTFFVNS